MAKTRRSTAEWSRIQKEAWQRRRDRQAAAEAQKAVTSESDALREMDARIIALSQAVTLLEAHVKSLTTQAPAPQVVDTNGNPAETLISAALRIMNKIDRGAEIGFLDYAALKRGVREAES